MEKNKIILVIEMMYYFNDEPIKVNQIEHIMIIGCGSVGSFISLCLSRIANRLTLVDHDILEAHNASTHTISFMIVPSQCPKSYAVHITLNALFTPCHVESIHERGEKINIAHLDFRGLIKYIIICVDSAKSRIDIVKHIKDNIMHLPSLKAIIDTGIDSSGYIITVINPNEIDKYINMMSNIPEREEDRNRACNEVRNIPVIVNLASQLFRVISKLEEESTNE